MDSLFGLLTGPDHADLKSRLRLIDRKLDLIMHALTIEPPDHPAADAIDEAIRAGRTIEAIKRLRDATGAGLAEAKRAVEDGSWRRLLGLLGRDAAPKE